MERTREKRTELQSDYANGHKLLFPFQKTTKSLGSWFFFFRNKNFCPRVGYKQVVVADSDSVSHLSVSFLAIVARHFSLYHFVCIQHTNTLKIAFQVIWYRFVVKYLSFSRMYGGQQPIRTNESTANKKNFIIILLSFELESHQA